MADQQHVITTVAIMSPGDMGHAIGRVLLATDGNRFRVITNLTGRSERTQKLSHSAGIIDVTSDEELVHQADIILSILVPSEAKLLAQRFAPYLAENERKLYVDMNAIAPQTIRSIASLFPRGNLVDGCILGLPPRLGEFVPSIYFSGEHAQRVVDLFKSTAFIKTQMAGQNIGQASGLKMCYASLNKGVIAVAIQACVTARFFGLDGILFDELKRNVPDTFRQIDKSIPHMAPKAGRWIGEMEEIAKTYEHIGLSPKIFEGAADTYRFVAEKTPLGDEIIEERQRGQSLDDALQIMAESLDSNNNIFK